MNGRAGLLVAAAIGFGAALEAAPPNFAPPTDYVTGGQLPPAEAKAALDQFRHSLPGQSYLEFELQHLPRRGPKVVTHGRMWTSSNDQGAVYRIELDQGPRFILQNGPQARVWRWSMGTTAAIPASAALQPGWELTAFDVQMPFTYWPLATGVTSARIRGRPADVFLFQAPGALAPLTGMRAYLDSEYHEPVQIESLAGAEHVLKTFSLLDVKSVSGRWIPLNLEVRDETTRNKTRLSVTGAALGLDLNETLFSSENLGEIISAPSGVQRW